MEWITNQIKKLQSEIKSLRLFEQWKESKGLSPLSIRWQRRRKEQLLMLAYKLNEAPPLIFVSVSE